MKSGYVLSLILLVFVITAPARAQDSQNATNEFPGIEVDAQAAGELVKAAHEYWRGQSSTGVMEMTIHRPDWERVMTIQVWTKGNEDSLFRVLEPARDKDNATLKRGREMWSYNPRVNRVVKIPPSMMSQAWMGSDFSNDDLSKTDSILEDYEHRVIGVEEHEGLAVYEIESIPLEDAPVVWGMIRLKVREDFIMLEELFFDEDMELVKTMTGQDIQMLGGRLMPREWRMQKADVEDEYTLLFYQDLEFDVDVPDRIFSLDSLRNPR
ncbi:MAG: outer membrane lipoprotein-sorting protein [Desulfovibrio sp.]|nr:MAG: outer membrane lipoprotein-sorting protein [Desulfovibrio sp.]